MSDLPQPGALVALDVIDEVRNGKKPNMQKIQQKRGYTSQSARAMKAKRTKAFKETMQPFLQSMIEERDAAIRAMKGKRNKAKYRDLTDAIDKLTKNIQLLNGGDTDKQTVTFTWE